MDQGLLCDLKGIVGSAEVPPAAGYVRPHQEGGVIRAAAVLTLIGFSLVLGGLLNLLPSLLPPKACKWTSVLLMFLFATVVMVEYLVAQAYGSFMRPTRILTGAAGVLTDYTDVVIEMTIKSWWRILIALIPVILVIAADVPEASKKRRWVILSLVLSVLGGCVGFGGMSLYSGGIDGYLSQYDFNAAIQEYGITVSMFTELSGLGNREDGMTLDLSELQVPTVPTASEQENQQSTPEEEAIVYQPHVIPGLDFAALAEAEKDNSLRGLYSYIAAQTPALENEYTGLFKGKNLIFITAEAFNYSIIDPELTPTLYRMANEGIRFEEYYQPLWGASTTSGEFSNVVGLVPTTGGSCMKEARQQDLFLTMGKQLQNLGYYSSAYHNHHANFYDRYMTHTYLGYDRFLGMYGGLEGVDPVWPESDVQMIEATIGDYIDQQPFSIYYMTVSGHCVYTMDENAQTRKHYDKVAHLDYSETVKYYLAAQMELELAMQTLLTRLEEAGILNDTVIAISTDHYPYGLEPGATWNNDKDYVAELYGYDPKNHAQRDHNALILWSGCLEDKNIVVEEPVYSLDILPTLSNLFGLEYDSRLIVGRDVFSDAEAIALWYDYTWVTEKGTYDSQNRKFIPRDGETVDEAYIQRIKDIVYNKIYYSREVQNTDYFNYLAEAMAEQ